MNLRPRALVGRYFPAAVLKVTGDDAFVFLQGQFTQDLRGCQKEPGVTYGLWINQKGKVLADSFVLYGPENAWWVISISCTAAVIRQRLEAYVIADDVVIEDVTAAWGGVAVLGEDATAAVEKVAGVLPPAACFSEVGGGMLFRGRRDRGETWEWLYPRITTAPADGLVAAGAQEAGEQELEARRIKAGLPAVPRDVGAEDLPNEAGLEQVAISYDKGCYLGQEVMARLHAMGQVRRRLLRVTGDGAIPPALPAPLFVREKKVGELRSAAGEGKGFVGFAMVTVLALQQETSMSLAPDEAPAVRL